MITKKKLTTQFRALSYILIADDDLDDQELLKDALEEAEFDTKKIRFVNDGKELVDSLGANSILPCMILLDLNMPRKGGREALAEIKANELYRHIPIIIFTTSDSDADVKACYSLGSNAFMTKPHSFIDLVDSMRVLLSFWFGLTLMVTD
jgi:CheY-like chemotaxis protein